MEPLFPHPPHPPHPPGPAAPRGECSRARAATLAAALLALASPLVAAACSSDRQSPPDLSPSPDFDGTPLACEELRDGGLEISRQVPGMLTVGGRTAECPQPGLQCPLIDTAEGLCDGGADAGRPYAQCQASAWVGRCIGAQGDGGP
jgi:hypothetical protein